MSNYEGLTHDKHKRIGINLYRFYRRKLYCKRNVHLFDEVQGSGGIYNNCDGLDHYLSCDACGLAVTIGVIDKQYQTL